MFRIPTVFIQLSLVKCHKCLTNMPKLTIFLSLSVHRPSAIRSIYDLKGLKLLKHHLKEPQKIEYSLTLIIISITNLHYFYDPSTHLAEGSRLIGCKWPLFTYLHVIIVFYLGLRHWHSIPTFCEFPSVPHPLRILVPIYSSPTSLTVFSPIFIKMAVFLIRTPIILGKMNIFLYM